MFTLAILGRPNVGKSTLFNKLAGKHLAIVDDTPGVTRDWRDAESVFFGRPIRLIDTAGLEEVFDESLQGRMRKQTEAALKQADAVLFVVDGRAGITPLDRHFARELRRLKKPVILVVNKCEHEEAALAGASEAYGLGLGQPVMLSAEHGEGFDGLYDALEKHLPPDENPDEDDLRDDNRPMTEAEIDALEGREDFDLPEEEIAPGEENPIKLAIVGRPNVGKSTLLNALVGSERVMTGPEAGTTRDAIAVRWNHEGHAFRLVDTAGLRRKSKITNNIEKMAVDDTLRAIRLAQVVVLVIDAQDPVEKQDLKIAGHVVDEGRALVIAVNKWDLIEDKKKVLEDIARRLELSLAQVQGLPIVTLSALRGKNVEALMNAVLEIYGRWNGRVKTSGLNRWLAAKESQNPAPLASGRANRLKYITQIKSRPPTFVLWTSQPDGIPDTYKRYIINGLREEFGLVGVPVRLMIRSSKNPYADKKTS